MASHGDLPGKLLVATGSVTTEPLLWQQSPPTKGQRPVALSAGAGFRVYKRIHMARCTQFSAVMNTHKTVETQQIFFLLLFYVTAWFGLLAMRKL